MHDDLPLMPNYHLCWEAYPVGSAQYLARFLIFRWPRREAGVNIFPKISISSPISLKSFPTKILPILKNWIDSTNSMVFLWLGNLTWDYTYKLKHFFVYRRIRLLFKQTFHPKYCWKLRFCFIFLTKSVNSCTVLKFHVILLTRVPFLTKFFPKILNFSKSFPQISGSKWENIYPCSVAWYLCHFKNE